MASSGKMQRNMKEACHSEAQKDKSSTECESHDVLCDAFSPHLAKLRMNIEFFREENCRLISQLHCCKEFPESAGLAPADEAMALTSCPSLSCSKDQGHMITAAPIHSLSPEAFHNHEDFHFAVVSSTLKEQIASTEKEWKLLAGRYNELVEQIQQSEKTLADVRNRNSELESMNAKLLSMMPYKAQRRYSQELQRFPSLNQVMDHALSTKSVNGKSTDICKGSVYTSPICNSEQKMGIACRGNNSGLLYSSPVSVLGESFDNEYFEDSVGVAYKSPAYTLRGRTESAEDMAKFDHAVGEDEYLRSDLFHALMYMPLAQEILPPDEAAPIKYLSDMLSESHDLDASAVESMPHGQFQCLNSVGIASKRQLTSMFDASLCLSEKEGCNWWSPRTSSPQGSSSRS